MKRETKISIAILVVGFFAIALYWFSDNKRGYSIEDERLVLPKRGEDDFSSLREVKEYLEDIKEALVKTDGVVPLDSSEIDSKAQEVQEFLLHNRAFLSDTRDAQGRLEHNDMMTIRPAIVSALSSQTKALCQATLCYQAEKYNFVTNTTTRAIVDVKNRKLLELKRFSQMQPDISKRLRNIAKVIALNAPQIKRELGRTPSLKDMSMANVRGSLNNSPCENENHLCVAPTFSYHNKEEALWAIVDLSDLKLVAAKWAGLGKTTTPSCISERSFQNREIMENYCQKDTLYSQDGWSLAYRITGSDGLEIIDATFNGQAVLKSAKIVDWHVAYKAKEGASSLGSSESYVAGRRIEYVKDKNDSFRFGYNDAMGCPMYSTSVVLPFNTPQIESIVKDGKEIGFYILQDYRNPKWPMACNYRYENRFEFYRDGSFRVVGVNIGRGCGENALYRPVMRIDLDLGAESFYKYENGLWQKWLTEQSDFQRDAKEYYKDKYLYKIENQKYGYFIEPNRGEFNDNSRGDNATLFATRFKSGEGDEDLLTLGSCCKLDEDGVERYIDSHESIDNQDIVLWYVPRIQNDARAGHEYCWADTVLEDGKLVVKEYPCIVGPKFVPIQ